MLISDKARQLLNMRGVLCDNQNPSHIERYIANLEAVAEQARCENIRSLKLVAALRRLDSDDTK